MKEFKDKNYYLKVLENRKEALKYAILHQDRSNKNDSLEVQSIQKAKNKLSIAKIQFDILYVMYSCEFSNTELKRQLDITIDDFANYWDKRVVKMHLGREQVEIDKIYLEYYIRLRWSFSFAVLLDVDSEKFTKLVNLLKDDNVKDALYDYMISSRIKDWSIAESLSLNKPKNKITDIIFENNKEKCENLIKNYLEKQWYKTYKNYGTYNSHTTADKHNQFKGYWAFEVATIVKIKELDDSSFRDNTYYPDRLV